MEGVEAKTTCNAGQSTDTECKGGKKTFTVALGDLPDQGERNKPNNDVGNDIEGAGNVHGLKPHVCLAGSSKVFHAIERKNGAATKDLCEDHSK